MAWKGGNISWEGSWPPTGDPKFTLEGAGASIQSELVGQQISFNVG